MSNVFLVRQSRLITPLLDRCGVQGVMRGLIFEIASKLGIPAEQAHLELGDVYAADEIFLTNSVIGVWPVVQVENVRLALGPVSRRMASQVDEAIAQEMRE